MEETQKYRENINLALDIINLKIKRQGSAHSALEAKISTLFGFVGIITAGVIALTQEWLELIGNCFAIFGIIGLGATLFLLITASRTRMFLDPPDFPNFYSEQSLNKDNLEFANQIIADVKESYEINSRHQTKKATLYDASLWVFFISLILIFIGIF